MSYTGFLCNRPPDWVGAVWEKYSYRIYKLCLQKCGTKEEADDLFQEVALRFCKKAGELKYGSHLLPWFNTVLLHCHYSEYRKKVTNREVPLSCLCEPKASYDGDDDDDAFALPAKGSITKRRMAAYQKMREKMMSQKDRLKMITGRDATLREIIEYAG